MGWIKFDVAMPEIVSAIRYGFALVNERLSELTEAVRALNGPPSPGGRLRREPIEERTVNGMQAFRHKYTGFIWPTDPELDAQVAGGQLIEVVNGVDQNPIPVVKGAADARGELVPAGAALGARFRFVDAVGNPSKNPLLMGEAPVVDQVPAPDPTGELVREQMEEGTLPG